MTTAIIHGDPGCFKTSSLVSEYGVPALYEGRVVVTNIRGFNSLEAVEKAYGKKLPESAQLISIPFTRDGFRKMGNFFHWVPAGALILFDEIQRVYPTRLRDLKMFDCDPPRSTGFVDKATGVHEDIANVEEAFDCHRHMNWDIYLSTPNIEKVHKELRQVAEFGYRQKGLRTVSVLLSKIYGDFKRVKHNADNKGNYEANSLATTFHRIDKRVYSVYQSTATGTAKETHTKNSIFSQPKLLLFGVFALCAIGYLVNMYASTGTVLPLVSGSKAVAESVQDVPVSNENFVFDSSPVSSGSQIPSASPVDVSDDSVSLGALDQTSLALLFKTLQSYNGSIKHGDTTRFLVEQKINDDLFLIGSDELEKLGFRVVSSGSFLVVYFGNSSKLLFPSRHLFVEEKAPQTMVF